MILDTSAVVAVFLKEPGYAGILEKIGNSKNLGVGSPTLVETGIVLTAKIGPSAKLLLAQFVYETGMFTVAFGPDHFQVAVAAYEKYGKGRHKASLNFGDCLTYAVAKLANQPLLCTGQDFSHTDLRLA